MERVGLDTPTAFSLRFLPSGSSQGFAGAEARRSAAEAITGDNTKITHAFSGQRFQRKPTMLA
jgi:hypothetical protein